MSTDELFNAITKIHSIPEGEERSRLINHWASVLNIRPTGVEALIMYVGALKRVASSTTSPGENGSVDELINKALDSGPKILAGDDIWVVEGNPELNQLNIKDIKGVYQMNLWDWVQGKNKGWILLGVFKSYEEGSAFCQSLRLSVKDIDGNVKIQ